MTTPQRRTRTNSIQRAAFSLVELMIVILIIGILVAIASPFIFGALTRAQEFTIENEMQQLNAAVERFNTDHGVYPPAIGPGLEIDTSNSTAALAAMRRYLIRIAPGNAEGNGSDGGGLQNWWENIGCKLEQDSSLVFWLSGLCTSKQYPLSGSALFTTTPLAPYNANKSFMDADLVDGSGMPISIDRNVFFEFKSDQLVNATSSAGAALPLGIKAYNQPSGKGDSLAYQYRDFKSYGGGTSIAYHLVDNSSGSTVINYFNPTSFQIVGPGMDGKITDVMPPTAPNTDLTDETAVDPGQDDNITNFSGGRLTKSYGS